MRILLFITGLSLGGAEKVVVSLADELATRGHIIKLVYMTGDAEVLPKNLSVKVASLGIFSKFDMLRAALRFRAHIRDFAPDVVHSHMVHANIFARLLRLVIPMKRLICTAHSSNEGGMLRMLSYRLTDELADMSTNVSEQAVSAFIEAKASKPSRMIAVHNGISLDMFSFDYQSRIDLRKSLMIDNSSRLILAVGRLVDAKDYPNLLKAFTRLASLSPNYNLCIVGDGPLRIDLEKLTKTLGVANQVKFLGARNDVASLLSAADIFVLSSAWEGFGLVVAEAMACERVIVATDCGGVKEVIGDTGYLVEPRNSEALAASMIKALHLSVDEAKHLGRKARQRVIYNYSIDTTVQRWLQLYSS